MNSVGYNDVLLWISQLLQIAPHGVNLNRRVLFASHVYEANKYTCPRPYEIHCFPGNVLGEIKITCRRKRGTREQWTFPWPPKRSWSIQATPKILLSFSLLLKSESESNDDERVKMISLRILLPVGGMDQSFRDAQEAHSELILWFIHCTDFWVQTCLSSPAIVSSAIHVKSRCLLYW